MVFYIYKKKFINIMSNSSLIFFNKEGYPHNFQYNQTTQNWEGKIIFDENSDQTFKTQSLHIFENVDPIDFVINADLIEIIYNNDSGLTLAGETKFKNEKITNIIKVNESDEFYSKWIYGYDFHKKFPVGTVITFSGVTGTTITSGVTDFSDDQYFTVLAVRKNAFLIITNTQNSIFDITFMSGYTSSMNMISVNDYNRNLYNRTFYQNLYTDKKFSIINSEYNDKIVSVKQSGITYSYLNELKLNGVKDQIFTLKIQLYTERPKISQSDITLTESQYINIGKYAYLLAPEIIYTSFGTSLSKKEIIFEDNYGNKLFSGSTFVVDSLVNTKSIGTQRITFKQYYESSNYQYNNTNKWNTIQISGYTDIKAGDIIQLTGAFSSGSTGSTYLMNNREFSITNVSYNNTSHVSILFTPGYIIDEDNSEYNITVKLQKHQIKTISVTPSGSVSEFNDLTFNNAYCYLTSTLLNFQQVYVSGTTLASVESNTIDTFINKYKPTLYQYGIDIYHSVKNNFDYLSIESLYGTKTKYFTVSGYTNNVKINDDFSLSVGGFTQKYNIIVNESLSNEKTNKSDQGLYSEQVPTEILLNLNNDTDRFGFRLTINGIQYSIGYSINTQKTINKFIDTYQTILYSNGFIINSGHSAEYSGYTLNITSDIDIWGLEVMVNILSTYKILQRNRNKSILFSGNEIKSYANLFDIGLATGMIIKLSGSSYNENNKEYNIISLTEDIIGLSYQGVFIPETDILLYGKTRDFIRKPRGDYDRDIYLRVYWEIPYDNVLDESIFLYDITGNQLKPYNNISALKYLGPTPLIDTIKNNIVHLNTEPNSDLSKIYNPKYQQTVFNELNFKLEQLDSSISYNWIPEPLEIFIGYNSNIEGVNSRILKIQQIEKFQNSDVYFSYTGYTNSGSSSIPNFILNGNTIEYKSAIDFSFITYGFKPGQIINIDFKDKSKKGQIIHENIYSYRILTVTRNKIIIDTSYTYNLNGYETGNTYNSSGFTYFTTTGSTFFFKIEVEPKEILYCPIYGQTEIEDIRFKVNLNNVGVQSEDDVYEILYQSDIEDNAIDYTLFNRKRKEMLSTYREIYDYIGSYKALVNAINYFGYNNLQLYEYYRNIDKSSSLYTKLHKVLIPDIFDNSIPGWNEMDFIGGKYQNQNTWKKTNLFNLAYRITDEDGNNILIYSLEEVQYKLTKLKAWLRKNIIPVSANLLDITGVADTNQTLYQDYDESNQTKKSVVERNSTVVNFNYTATLNFNTDYLITVNFYILSGATGTTLDYNEVPLSFTAKIKTYYLSGSTVSNPTDILIPVQYFKINKNDLKPFSLNKNVDPYIYIETTTYDNGGNGLGYVNNKLFFYDEPRNFWLVNHNFDLTKMRYWQTENYINNTSQKWIAQDIIDSSTIVSSSVETNVKVNTLNKTYLSQISTNNTNANS